MDTINNKKYMLNCNVFHLKIIETKEDSDKLKKEKEYVMKHKYEPLMQYKISSKNCENILSLQNSTY